MPLKWLEAVAYSLAVFPDEDLEQKADELIEKDCGTGYGWIFEYLLYH